MNRNFRFLQICKNPSYVILIHILVHTFACIRHAFRILDSNTLRILDTDTVRILDANTYRILDSNTFKIIDANTFRILDANDFRILDANAFRILNAHTFRSLMQILLESLILIMLHRHPESVETESLLPISHSTSVEKSLIPTYNVIRYITQVIQISRERILAANPWVR